MKKQTAGRDALGKFVPKFAELNDDVRRSLVEGGPFIVEEPIDDHDQRANGKGNCRFFDETSFDDRERQRFSKEDIAELITHAAFYAGWPNAWRFSTSPKRFTRTKSRSKITAVCSEWAIRTSRLLDISQGNPI